ncbi:unnamed protein product [Adineta ricciae]|uniref:Uncharacterized protein n=1 Tax=Adineta ricciae TaxID=249248 RepID=A0A815SGV3_ADIRI|nr:unnamed protein product [Adineta ricciae]
MEQGPALLWLNSPNDLNDSTNDSVMTFPLQETKSLYSCIVCNPVCGFCAPTYINTMRNSSDEKLKTLYRESCSGFIPLNWSTQSNRDYINGTLCGILTGNRILHHVSMLLLAMIDDHKSNWFNEEIRKFLINQIAENISSNDSFLDEGTRMPFVNAIQEVIKQEHMFLRQPFTAFCRILKFNFEFHQLNIHTIITLLRKRFLLMCIQTYCFRIKYHSEILIKQVYEMLFDTFNDVPLWNSLKSIDINDKPMKAFLSKDYDELMPMLDQLAESIGCDRTRIFPNEFVSFVLYLLTTLSSDGSDRPIKLYNNLAYRYESIRGDFNIQWDEVVKLVDEDLLNASRMPSDIYISGYVINLGQHSRPSKLFLGVTPLWDESMENQRISVVDLARRVQSKLNEQLKKRSNGAVANQSILYFPLHLAVAEVIENSYSHNENITDEMILDFLTIEDYLKFRKTTINMTNIINWTNPSWNRSKLIAELMASGMEYDRETETVLFDSIQLKVPCLISIKNSGIDFKSLIVRVQQLHLARNASSMKINSTCLDITIKDITEFSQKKELERVSSSIEVHVDQIDE